MNKNAFLSTIVATLGATLALVSTSAVAGKPGSGGSGSCSGATAAFVFSKGATNTLRKDLYLANASATCQRYLFTFSAGYNHYSSFRVVATETGVSEGRVVTTEGGKDLILVRFPIGSVDMQVDPASVTIQRIFDPLQAGTIDVVSFELAADGKRLAYVTSNEDGGNTSLSRLRVIPDVVACAATAVKPACLYSDGMLLAEHVGLSSVFDAPHWSTTGSYVYVNDRRGDFKNPNISKVSSTAAYVAPHEPEVVISGNGNQLRLFELRSRVDQEVLVYGDAISNGCHNVRAVSTDSCSGGSCLNQINSSSPRVLVIRFASLQSIDSASMTILADGGKEDSKGNCSGTDQIVRAVDSSSGVQITSLTSGAGPASR